LASTRLATTLIKEGQEAALIPPSSAINSLQEGVENLVWRYTH
jgi:hypothetical protein